MECVDLAHAQVILPQVSWRLRRRVFTISSKGAQGWSCALHHRFALTLRLDWVKECDNATCVCLSTPDNALDALQCLGSFASSATEHRVRT